jgi:hypothetical protein
MNAVPQSRAPSFDPRRIHEVPDDLLAAIDYCYEQGWTDGLPVIPPAIERVEATLAFEGRPPEAVIATHPATGLQLTVHAAAVNAVMAGCLPEYFPVLVAAFEAMDKPEFNFHGSTASTGGSAPLLIVSGPVTDDIGMNADVNLFGPGNRANATIGRATRLILRNVFQMIPGISDKSTQGNPGKYSFCVAERSRGNPVAAVVRSAGLSAGRLERDGVRGGRVLQRREPWRQHARAGAGLHRRCHGQLRLHHARTKRVILAPEHMQIIANAGWSREKTQEFLFASAKRSVEGMKSVGKYRDREYDRQHAAPAHASLEAGFMHRGCRPRHPDHDGGGDAGGHSCFIPSWSRGRGSLMQHKPIGVCIDCD